MQGGAAEAEAVRRRLRHLLGDLTFAEAFQRTGGWVGGCWVGGQVLRGQGLGGTLRCLSWWTGVWDGGLGAPSAMRRMQRQMFGSRLCRLAAAPILLPHVVWCLGGSGPLPASSPGALRAAPARAVLPAPGRILNISLSAADAAREPPRLLNYLTAPHVVVWSAAAPCCAALGGAPQELLARSERGELVRCVRAGRRGRAWLAWQPASQRRLRSRRPCCESGPLRIPHAFALQAVPDGSLWVCLRAG